MKGVAVPYISLIHLRGKMKKTSLSIIFLVIAKLCWAEGYETKTVFVLDTYPDTNKLSRAVLDCIRGTAEEDNTDKIGAMLGASLAYYQAELAYRVEEARLNGRTPSKNDTKYNSASKQYSEALVETSGSSCRSNRGTCAMSSNHSFIFSDACQCCC